MNVRPISILILLRRFLLLLMMIVLMTTGLNLIDLSAHAPAILCLVLSVVLALLLADDLLKL